MKITKEIRLSLLILLILTMISCDNSSPSKVNLEVEKAAIQTIIDGHLDAVDSLDVTRLLNGMTEDHVEMPPNMSRLVGKQAYGEYFSTWIGFFESLKQKEMSFVPDEFVVTGDWAFQIGTYSTKFTLQDDSLIEDTGNYVWIFKKDNDGNWNWARVISNSTKQIPISE
jgi:ketosteroid isomerase-like protein